MPRQEFCETCNDSGWVDGEDDIYLCACPAGEQREREDLVEFLDRFENIYGLSGAEDD